MREVFKMPSSNESLHNLRAPVLVLAVVVVLAALVAAATLIDWSGESAVVEPYAPYTAGPVVPEDFRPYAPYTAGPVVDERPYAPYTAGPVVREVPKAPDPYEHYPYR